MIKVFYYIIELDCFTVTPVFKTIADQLKITEWNEVVWVGRFFTLDNDYGEHWFDNWDEREAVEIKAAQLGHDAEFLFFINPERFRNGKDGPCHSDEEIKRFWTDVLKSLHLSLDTIFAEARRRNRVEKDRGGKYYLPDLENKIEIIRKEYSLA